MVKQISKDMIIADVLEVDPDIAGILIQNGMGCIFCFASQSESVEEACFVHGIDPDEIIEQVMQSVLDTSMTLIKSTKKSTKRSDNDES